MKQYKVRGDMWEEICERRYVGGNMWEDPW